MVHIMNYFLLCYEDNSSIIVGIIGRKDGLNVKNSINYGLLTILSKITVQLLLI